MAYTDTFATYYFSDSDGTAWEFEQTADILFRQGRIVDVGTGTSAETEQIHLPHGGSVESFGVVLSEAITSSNTQRLVAKVQYLSILGASAAAAVTMTLPMVSDGVAGNGTSAAPGTIRPTDRTLVQGNAVGARIVCPNITTTANVGVPGSKVMPFACAPGSAIYVEVTTAQGASGGAGFFWVTVRHNGINAATTASPVQLAYSAA